MTDMYTTNQARTTSNVTPDVLTENLRRLAVNVIMQALADLTAKDPIRSLDAAMFLSSRAFGLWAECAGVPFGDGVTLLTSEQVRDLSKQAAKFRRRTPMFEFAGG